MLEHAHDAEGRRVQLQDGAQAAVADAAHERPADDDLVGAGREALTLDQAQVLAVDGERLLLHAADGDVGLAAVLLGPAHGQVQLARGQRAAVGVGGRLRQALEEELGPVAREAALALGVGALAQEHDQVVAAALGEQRLEALLQGQDAGHRGHGGAHRHDGQGGGAAALEQAAGGVGQRDEGHGYASGRRAWMTRN